MPENGNIKTIPLSRIAPLMERARKIAIEYQLLTGKPLGIVGEIGEYEAARCLKLKLAIARTPGHDAIDSKGRILQIKARRTTNGSPGKGRTGVIRLTHPWDALLLVMLNEEFLPTFIYEASRADVERVLLKPGSNARNLRGQPSVSSMKRIGRLVWQAKK